MRLRGFLIVLLGTATLIGLLPATGRAAVPRRPLSPAAADSKADFNGDGFADLAIGVPGEDVIGVGDAGAVSVIYGGATGLQVTAPPDQIWHRASGIQGSLGIDDHFGAAVTFGDFDGDGFDDLAIGTPDDDTVDAVDAGRVNVLYGSAAGLGIPDNQIWDQSAPGVRGLEGIGDRFGAALSSADYNGDGFADLSVGVPGDLVGSDAGAGAVAILYGTHNGITAERPDDQLWTQDSPGVKEESAPGDAFGAVLTSGDFNNDGFDDLAATAPNDDTNGVAGAGVVTVLYGEFKGLQSGRRGLEDQFWTQDTTDVLDTAEVDDAFGQSLGAGDFNGDGFDDLAIGVPLEDIDVLANAGGVNVLYGSVDGLSTVGNQFWSQDSSTILDTSEAEDRFGAAVATGDFNGDTFLELAVGAPGETDAQAEDPNAGAVNVVIGSVAGLTDIGNQFWTQDSPGVAEQREEGDGFGSSLAASDFGNGAQDDLSIGVPGESVGAVADAGLINVLFGSVTGLASTGNQSWSQNKPDVEDDSEDGDAFGASQTA